MLFNLEEDYPVFLAILKYSAQKTNFLIHHFVLMKNHFHLVGSTPNANLYQFMHLFQTTFSKALNTKKDRINHIFGNRYGATVIQSIEYMTKIIQYVYLNPFVAKVVNNPFNYRYSSLKLFQNDTWMKNDITLDPLLKAMSDQGRKDFLLNICYHFLEKNESEKIQKNLKSNKI